MPPTTKNVSTPSSILAAAVGLTSLGAPDSPGNDWPAEADGGGRDAKSKISKPPYQPTVTAGPVAGMVMQPPRTTHLSMMPHAPHPRPPAHDHMSLRTYHAAAVGAAGVSRPGAVETFLPTMPPVRPTPSAGFGAMHPVPSMNPHPAAAPLSSAAMAMDRFPMAGRVASMDQAAALAAPHPSPYGHYYPYPAPHGMMIPLLSTPHQITPVPNTKNFPETLFDVVSMPEHAHIISWLPHGRGFKMHDKQRFASMILPRYFDGAKFTSFTRRLKRWNFVREPRGPELGAYYNKNFVRDQPELVQEMSYKMDCQFDEAKANSKECSEGEKKSKEKPKKEKVTKAKYQDGPSKKKEKGPPRPPSQEESVNRQVRPSSIPSPEVKSTYLANHQAQYHHSVPLSESLSQREAAFYNASETSSPEVKSTYLANHQSQNPHSVPLLESLSQRDAAFYNASKIPCPEVKSRYLANHQSQNPHSVPLPESLPQRDAAFYNASKIPSPEVKSTYLANHQSQYHHSVPLPESVPQRDAAFYNAHQYVAGAAPNEARGIYPPRALAESSLLTSAHPTMVTPNYPNDGRTMNSQREQLLARSAMSHDDGRGVRPGPTSGAIAKYDMTGRYQGHPYPYYTSPTASRGMIDANSARLLLESERAMGRGAGHHTDRCYPRDAAAPPGGMMDVGVRDMHTRLDPSPFVDRSEHPGVLAERRSMVLPARHNQEETYGHIIQAGPSDGGRPVLMNQEEQKHFAEYLATKREGHCARQWP